jgi:cyclic pyranopterin phosphate synthase
MKDLKGRNIEYVRISITDKCNLRCIYCMSQEGVSYLPHEEILSYQEIIRVVRCMTGLGLKSVRLTGGEPMARRGCLDLVKMLREIDGVERIGMTTNGILMKGCMHKAREAGLDALNISVDSLDPVVFSRITRGGDVGDVLSAIDEALDAGLRVKINSVPISGYNEEGLEKVAALSEKLPIEVRFIELMPVGYGATLRYIPMDTVKSKIEAAFGPLEPDREKHGDGPAVYFKPSGFKGSIGFIGAVSHEFCDSCNRVRITPEGLLKLCLNHLKGLDLRELLRSGISDEMLTEQIREAVLNKPENHGFNEPVKDRETRRMNQIGG